jgi:aspartate/methionine/tyrosine aminotransferase
MNIKPFKLERFFAKYEFNAPYLLCTSDCESFAVEELLQLEEGAEESFKRFRLGYTESPGNPELREAISSLYSNVKPGHVIVCAGAEEGIFIFMNVLLGPGDHIIVQSPCYQSLYEIAASLGCRVTQWHMDADKNWGLDIDFLKDHITPQTKAIIVNFPNNPTGYLPSQEDYRHIIDIAGEHDIYLFSDEVYRFLEYDVQDRLPAGCDEYDKAVSLGVMSKAFGLAGLRIGWVVIKDSTLFDRFSAFKDFTTICSSGPSEFLAGLALKHKTVLLNRNLDIITANLQQLAEFFNTNEHYFKWNPPKAGPLAFPELLTAANRIESADAFCMDLLEKTGVLLLPGSNFNCKEPGHYIRFGFGRKNMPQALEKLEGYLAG